MEFPFILTDLFSLAVSAIIALSNNMNDAPADVAEQEQDTLAEMKANSIPWLICAALLLNHSSLYELCYKRSRALAKLYLLNKGTQV